LLGADVQAELSETAEGDDEIVPLSAVTGFGCDALLERLGALLTRGARLHRITLPASDGARIAWLHQHGEVVDETAADEGASRCIEVRLSEKEYGRFAAMGS
jgi:GTP-binding protein HflX